MEKKSLSGIFLALAGLGALIAAVAGLFAHYITPNLFAGLVLLGCLSFFSGLTVMRDQLHH
jgi:hypothetical protein